MILCRDDGVGSLLAFQIISVLAHCDSSFPSVFLPLRNQTGGLALPPCEKQHQEVWMGEEGREESESCTDAIYLHIYIYVCMYIYMYVFLELNMSPNVCTVSL